MADSVGFHRREAVRLLPYLAAQPLAATLRETLSSLKFGRSVENTEIELLSFSSAVSRVDKISNESIVGM